MNTAKKEALKKIKSKHKKSITLLLCLILMLLSQCKKPTTNKHEQIETITITEDISKKQIQISGNIEAAQEQILQAPGEGLVTKVYIKEGDTVKKGQAIFALDSSAEEMRVAQQEFAIATEKINGASIRLGLMKQELRLLKKRLNERTVRAKFNGIVAMFSLNEGYYAKAQDNFGVIIDRSFLKSTVAVSERDSAKLAIGEKVLLEFPALPNTELTGEITAYPSIAKANSSGGETVVEAKLVIKEPPDAILPGYSFYGKIVYGKDQKVILIKQSALFYDKGKVFVKKVLTNNQTEKVPVEVEQYIEGIVKLVSGNIKAGDVLQNSFSRER